MSDTPINATDRVVTASSKKRRRFTPRKIILSLGFIVIVSLLGTLLITVLGNRGEDSTSNQVKSVLSGDDFREYNSPENGFIINFPGFPTVGNATTKTNDKDVPVTTYERSIENNQKNYTMRVYDYTGFDLDVDKTLESALNNSLQNTPNAKVLSTEKGVYGEHKAIEAAYTITENEKTYDANIRYIIKDNKMYSIILIGDSKEKFKEFADSLKFS